MPKVRPTEPLADVNVLPRADGSTEIVACFMPQDPLGEGAEAVLAIDGSRSMSDMFGGGIFAAEPNYVQAVARKTGELLTGLTRSGAVTMLFWALGPGGSQVREIGTFDKAGCGNAEIDKPDNMGTGTQLLPVLKYICDKVNPNAGMTLGVVITDGILEDVDAYKQYSQQVGQEVADGRRNALKLVLIGVGSEVDEGQLEDLDDLFEGTPLKGKIDLYSSGIASSMKKEYEIRGAIFGELAREDKIIAPSGSILDSDGNVVKDCADGLPEKLRFVLPAGATAFTIHTPHGDVTQDITEGLAT